MTNLQIISAAMHDNNITVACNTYQVWLSLGYHVRRGEKAAFKAKIWLPSKSKKKASSEDDDIRLFMKTAFFFTADQVQKIP